MRPPIFFGGACDGVLVPIAWAGRQGYVQYTHPDATAGELTYRTYCPFDVSVHGIGTIVWCPDGDTPDHYRDRIRLYLSSGLRRLPRSSDGGLEAGDN